MTATDLPLDKFEKTEMPGFRIFADPSRMVQDSLIFSLKSCVPDYDELGVEIADENGYKCPPKAEVDHFMKAVTVEVWTIHDKISF